mgnify:FL=1
MPDKSIFDILLKNKIFKNERENQIFLLSTALGMSLILAVFNLMDIITGTKDSYGAFALFAILGIIEIKKITKLRSQKTINMKSTSG